MSARDVFFSSFLSPLERFWTPFWTQLGGKGLPKSFIFGPRRQKVRQNELRGEVPEKASNFDRTMYGQLAIEKLKKKISEFTSDDVSINLVEIRKPEVEAQLIADAIAEQLERRVSFRRAMKRSVQSAMRLGADGIRVNCGGRLGGTEIARTEWYREGRVPLHTFRANVDYAIATAQTTYGACGIKVWIYKGDIDDNAPHEMENNPNKLG